jgi:cytochrome c1
MHAGDMVVQRRRQSIRGLTLAAFLIAFACTPPGDEARLAAALTPPVEGQSRTVEGGDAARGAALVRAHGCGACHVIPGVAGAVGQVGPPLTSWRQRAIIAGRLPNTPSNLIAWIQTPQTIEPGTAMPNLGLSEQEARDVAAYLYTIR